MFIGALELLSGSVLHLIVYRLYNKTKTLITFRKLYRALT
jgi:hypothetical protein